MPPSLPLATATAATLAVALAGYLLACMVAPFARCRRCHGTGRLRTLGRTIGGCHRCNATGRRLRHGRRLYNHLRRLHDDAL